METETLNKVQTPERINDTRKAELLSSPVEHIDITKFDARPIIDSMGKMSFTSRDLARATGIYNHMLEDPSCSPARSSISTSPASTPARSSIRWAR